MEGVATTAPHAAQGHRIRTAMVAAGLTVAALTNVLEAVSRQSVDRWALGETSPQYWRRPALARALGVPYHFIFIPEETAEELSRGARRLLLTAHHLRGGGPEHFYVETGPADRTDGDWLAKLWLAEDNGAEHGRRLWHLTGAGEDVLAIVRGEQR
jgi:transcriptional regulator with XRE-family HTH domain